MSQYQRRRRRRRWWRYYPYNFIIAIATLLVILALVITACVSRCNSADAVDHTEETADLTVQPIYGTGWETNPPTAETTPEPDPEDRPTIKGGHYAENGEVVCDACGCADLQFVYHADGKDRYRNGYNCTKCGAVVQMIFKRR